ncbi:MAG: MlaD family protein [Phycisphaerales bacterium]|nr:MlaD family protein [Phycisphaerales bacterium]
MSTRHSDNNVKAGLFVLISLALGIVVIFILGDFWGKMFGPAMSTYDARFTVSEGVGFLKKGSDVRVGGLNLGKVLSVTPQVGEGPLRDIEVSFTLPEDVPLYTNAVATVQNGLISSDSYVLVSSVGWDVSNRSTADSGAPGEQLQPGDVLQGTPSGGMIGALLGPESGAALAGTIASVEAIAHRLEVDGKVLEWIIGEQEAESMSAGLGDLGDLFQKLDRNGFVIEWVLGDEAAGDLRRSLSDVETISARVKSDWTGVDGEPGWSAKITTILDQGDNIAEAIQRVREFIVNNESKVQAMVDNLTSAVSDAKVVIADLHAHAPLWMADVGDTLANLELASQQLDLLLAEARNAPWRLLYQPSEKQISGELLYEASRNFVFGAADLKSAAASMDQLVKVRGASLNESAQDFQLVRDNLMNAVKRYEKAQSQLSQVLSAEPPTSE